jgi:hypothetical protein
MCEPATDENSDSDVRADWIVQGDAAKSGAVMAALANDPQVRLLKQIASDVLLLEMTPAQAEELKTRFGSALIIERDQPITPIE